MKKEKTVLFQRNLDTEMKEMFEFIVLGIVQERSYEVNPDEKFIATATVTASEVRQGYVTGMVTEDYAQEFDLFKKKRVDVSMEFDQGEILKIVIMESY